MTALRLGSLCTGYGGLDAAVGQVLDVETVWHADPDPGAAAILAHHWPTVPNLGDITATDWTQVPPVDVLTAGYPCQPFSVAGKRSGTNDNRHLWPLIAGAVGALQPSLVAFENVSNHLNIGFDVVLRDLDWLGYDVAWLVNTASGVGAPHRRARLFILGVRRESRVYSRSARWGRDDRHQPHPGGHVCDSSRGWDDRCGCVGHQRVATRLRRSGQPDEAGRRESPAEAPLGGRGGVGGARSGSGAPVFDPEAGSSRSGAGVAGAASGLAGGIGSELLEPRQASRGGDIQAAAERDEPTRRDSQRVASASRSAASGGAPLGRVVGADGGSVRTCAFQGKDPALRVDAGRADLSGGAADGSDLLAWPADAPRPRLEARREGRPGRDATADAAHLRHERGGRARYGRPGPADGCDAAADAHGSRRGPVVADVRPGQSDARWGSYAPAIQRWEHVTGRPAPAPTELGRTGNPRLSPRFVEWLMGLPAGHVTSVPGLTRTQQLRALGNGVVPQQGASAVRLLLERAGLAEPMEVAA